MPPPPPPAPHALLFLGWGIKKMVSEGVLGCMECTSTHFGAIVGTLATMMHLMLQNYQWQMSRCMHCGREISTMGYVVFKPLAGVFMLIVAHQGAPKKIELCIG